MEINDYTRRKLWKDEQKWVMRESSRHRQHPDLNSMRVTYIGIDGTITLPELIQWAEENGIPPEDLHLNYLTMRYLQEPTPEEIESDRKADERRAAARESWDRKMLADLKAKYE